MNNRHAFTLVELLTVIVIIGILAAIITVAVAGAFRATQRGKIATEMAQIAMALDRYRAEFGEYPPDMFDDEALVRHVRKRWPRLNWANLRAKNAPPSPGFSSHPRPWWDSDPGVTQLQRDAWAIRNAVSLPYGTINFNGNLYPVNFNDYLHRHPRLDEVGELLYSRAGALALWLGGFPNSDGKLSGFYADPENPFTPINTFDGNVFLDLEIGRNVRFSCLDVRGRPVLVDDTRPLQIVYRYAIPVLGTEVRGTFMPFAYFRGRASGGHDAYLVNGTFKWLAGPTAHNLEYMSVPYVASVSSDGVIRWKNPTTYQLIHPGLDGNPGLPPSALPPAPADLLRVISTGAGISVHDLDNLTNFSDNRELRSILP